MHEYSTDIEQNKIFFNLAIISIVCSSLVTTLFNKLIAKLPFIEFSISIAAVSIFSLLYYIFDKYVWKWKILRKTGIIQTPDLNGIWKGTLKSSYDNFKQELPATLSIEQTWSKICIRGEFNDSKSSSYTASLKVNNGKSTQLIYSYYNDKNQQSYNKNISNHRGYGSLEINNTEIKGIYFNNPNNNKNHGYLKLSKCT